MYPILLHGIAVTDSNGVIFLGLVVYGNAEWSADGILAAVALANSILFFIEALEVRFTLVHNITGKIRQTIFFSKRENSQFDRCQHRWYTHYHTAIGTAVFFR